MENPPWISRDSAGPCSLDASSSEISSLLRSGLKTLLGHAALRVVNLNVRVFEYENMLYIYICVCVCIYLFIYLHTHSNYTILYHIIFYYVTLYHVILHYIV